MSYLNGRTRILALDLGVKEMGYALLEGDILIRYGVRNFKKRVEKVVTEIAPGIDLIKSYKPRVLILGKLSHPARKGNPKLKKRANQIKRFAIKQGMLVHEIDPASAIKSLNKDRKLTKFNTATLITAIYPELSVYLPRRGRILWTSKDLYWMNMFDALTLALAYIRKRKRGKHTTMPLKI